MTTSEKVAYLKGLAEGLNMDKSSNESKLFTAVIDVLDSMASDIEDLEIVTDELGDELDATSDDLSVVEDIVYDEEDYDEDDYDELDEEPVLFEITCPKCNNTITVDEDVIALGTINCPNCNEVLDLVVDCCDEDGCCDDDCCDEDGCTLNSCDD